MKNFAFGLAFLAAGSYAQAQSGYWQQQVNYEMNVDFDVETNQYKGQQKLVYSNHSPDTLRKVFFHLYPNAFQPNSMMDMRSRTISDPDRRVGDRISTLSKTEVGYLRVKELKQDGKAAQTKELETILQVQLDHPLPPGASTTLELQFEGQIPLQVRRSGRDNREGIRLSMSQWYPKMCEYDREGWHANPYIGREFHGVWGDFDVKIQIDGKYIMGATGELQNGDEIGFGYEKPGKKVKDAATKTWHWKAENVHDFVWAADPDYKHVVKQVQGGPTVHYLYQPGTETEDWEALPVYVAAAFQEMNKRFGVYPYRNFYVIQGGDGGMEYPMATLITGNRNLESLVGVTVHEMFHSWYQGVLATNESLYPWMDEGFTSYAESEVMAKVFFKDTESDPHAVAYLGYFSLVKSGLQEPMSTHADHYKTNRAYSTNAYSKGELTLAQMAYIIGQETLEKAMRLYFNSWKFKHPTPTDFKHCLEKVANMELDWYFEYWINTTETIDYAMGQVSDKGGNTLVEIRRIGNMPMPSELLVTYSNGSTELFYIPLSLQYGSKQEWPNGLKVTTLEPWPWTHPGYVLEVPAAKSSIVSLQLDPFQKTADIDRANNVYSERPLVPGAGM